MPKPPNRSVFVCTEGFSPAAPAGQAPTAFRPGTQVLEGDPILRTHGQFFVPAADRVEQATAAPGERRAVVPPNPDSESNSSGDAVDDIQTPHFKEADHG